MSGCNGRNLKGENARETEGKQRSKGVEIGTEPGAFLTNMLNPFHCFIHEFNNPWVKMEDVGWSNILNAASCADTKLTNIKTQHPNKQTSGL